MASRKESNGASGKIVFVLVAVIVAIKPVVEFVKNNADTFKILALIAVTLSVVLIVAKRIHKKQREELLDEILNNLHLKNIESILKEFDDGVIVKSKQALENYTDLKYLKETGSFDNVRRMSEYRKYVNHCLGTFLKNNTYEKRPQYDYVRNQLVDYMQKADGYNVLITYITSAGNIKGRMTLHISTSRVDELVEHPEYLMTKGEYNKVLRQQAKDELDAKKHSLYERVNEIIDFANDAKEKLIIKTKEKAIDDLVQKLFDKTVNSIQRVSRIDSDEWGMLESFITTTYNQISKIVQDDKRISDYYESESFANIKNTCRLLTQSQREFNEYINEKAQSISKLFGTRVIRNETQNEDVYSYIRTYKKSITPFTAEVSSAVFGSAENNPIGYIVKYFYPNKSQYTVQIEKLRVLVEELETLKEAKVIIDNYKKDYAQYIQDVPKYVMDNDEAGFYSRLGLAVIDESVLNVEYKFSYTSDGGMAQRSFSVPMNEENIAELINQLESRLSLEALAKEQRAMMTTKLRTQIKERDNYTCCQCGNSVFAEPNLLLEIDHIIPVSKGGLTQENNLQTLCWKCNRNKGARIII